MPKREVISARALRCAAGAVLLVLAGLSCSPSSDPSSPTGATDPPGAPRNVLLVTFDTTRADAIGCYGGPDGITPNVDRLAANGVRYTMAHCSVPLTLPSHTTLLSGLEPYTHGVRDNGLYHVAPSVTTLAEILQAKGFETAAFVSSYVLDSQFGLSQGFELYDDHVLRGQAQRGTLAERPASAVTDVALEWLEKRSTSRPFFAWLHYFDPHHPYEPPDSMAERFPDQPYHAEIAYADAELGRFLAALRRDGLADDTLVVFTADHGEGRGEHGEPTHGHFLYEATIHVPLIFDHASLPHGETRDGLARLTDVAPSILSLLGLDIPESMEGQPLLEQPENDEEHPIAYSESELARIVFGFRPLRSVTDGRLKLISGPHDELYDLSNDPGEQHDLSARRPEKAKRMRQLIDRLMETARTLNAVQNPGQAAMSRIADLGYAGGVASAEVTTAEWTNDQLLEMITLRDETKSLLTAGQTKEAIEQARKLTAKAPQSHVGLDLLGTALSEAGRFEEALEVLSRAVALQPRLPEAQWNIAVCYARTGRLREAMEQCEKVLEIDPHHFAANQKLAEQALRAGDLAEARKHLRVLIDYGGRSGAAKWAKETLQRIGP